RRRRAARTRLGAKESRGDGSAGTNKDEHGLARTVRILSIPCKSVWVCVRPCLYPPLCNSPSPALVRYPPKGSGLPGGRRLAPDGSAGGQRVTNERATGRDIILAIGENMRESLEPLVTETIAPSLYQVYLHADDYDHLRTLFGKIEAEARKLLDGE